MNNLLDETVFDDENLYHFAQWFSYHYGGGISGSQYTDYPRHDILDIVSDYIKTGKSKVGFIKWFAETYGMYPVEDGRGYQVFTENEIINKVAKNRQEWIDQHFSGGYVTNGLIKAFLKDKESGNIFNLHSFEELEKELTKNNIIIKMLSKEWSEFNATEGYEKRMQDIKLKNGDVVTNCWPNAGFWMCVQKEGNEKYYGKEDIEVSEATHVRLSHNKYFNDED